MKKIVLLSLLYVLGTNLMNAQSCGFDYLRSLNSKGEFKMQLFDSKIEEWKAQNPTITLPPTEYNSLTGGNCTRARYIIPVVVHVVHDPNDAYGQGSNISYAQIQNQIDALNRIFSNKNGTATHAVNTGIQFCLQDTTRTSSILSMHRSSEQDLLMNTINNTIFGANPKSDQKFLNIYVVKEILDSGGLNTGIRGYATYPASGGRQGVVMQASRFGDYGSCTGCVIDKISEGKVLAHEVGHYLGLYHTFEGACAGMDSTTCNKEGDKCCDTPPVAAENNSCTNNYYNSCSETPHREDMVENYMDYTPDNCRNTFTHDQAMRMHFTLSTTRSSIVDVNNINDLNLSCCIFSAHFNVDNALLCSPDTMHFTAFEYTNSPTYTWEVWEGTTLIASHIDTVNTWAYYMKDTVIYDVELTININGDIVKFKNNKAIELRDCGAPIASTQGNWYFGYGAGLQFRENGVIPSDSANTSKPPQINASEGCITISDSLGHLLFFGGGNEITSPITLYDKNYLKIKLNSTGLPVAYLNGTGSTSQGIVSFPYPSDTSKYYVITNTANNSWGSLYYSILDLSLGTAGQIDSANYNKAFPCPPVVSCYVNEQLQAAPHCNGEDYWVFTTSHDGYALVYKATSSGITYHSNLKLEKTNIIATIKLSPDGTMLAVGKEILYFDKVTGVLSKYLEIPVGESFYSMSFSPNSKLFYYLTYSGELYQINLSIKNPLLFKRQIGFYAAAYSQSLQLAPDGKIYMAVVDVSQIAVMNYPNALSTDVNPNACDFTLQGPSLTIGGVGGSSGLGLPNMIDVKKEGEYEKEIKSVQWACDSIDFSTNVCCASTYSWDFGDGNTSSTKNTLHKYSTNGTYYISLVVDSDTLYDTITVGASPISILGKNAACDTINTSIYQTSPSKNLYSYSWSTDNGVLSTTNNGKYAHVKWPQDGNLYVTVTDNETGCASSDTQAVTVAGAITNNFISGPTVYCDTAIASDMLITGSIPSGGLGTYVFKWYRSKDKNSWEGIIGATDKNYIHTGTKKYYYYRTAVSGCESNSILMWKEFKGLKLTIELEHEPCITDSLFRVEDRSKYSSFYPDFYLYKWEYSYDSSSWYEDTTGTYTNGLSRGFNGSTIYIRSKVKSLAYCYQWFYSNVVKITNPIFSIKTQPKDVFVCDGECVPISIGLNNSDSINLTYSFLWLNICGNSLYESTDSVYAKLYTNGADSFRVKVTGVCGQSIYSDYAKIHYNLPADSLYFTKQPVDFYGNNNPIFTASPNTQYATITWEKSYDRGTTWLAIPNEKDTLLNFTETVECDKLVMIRAVLLNSCNTVYSNVARLFPHEHDLWIKDLVQDAGAEPFADARNNFTHSPDMWIRYTPDNIKYSNPWGAQSINYQFPKIDTSNYIYTTIRNRGTETSGPAKLHVYWTLASTGELWPLHWVKGTGNKNRFYNADSMKWYPMGGEVNLGGIHIDPIAPGDSLNIPLPWIDSIPNLGWYYRSVGGIKTYFQNIGVCFLARIETCNEAPYGMTYPEDTLLDYNVPFNNNIASHNTVLSKLHPPSTFDPGIFTWVPVRNVTNIQDLIDIGLDFNDGDYFNYSEIIVMLDDSLETKWIAAGQMGAGYTMISSNTLLIDNPSIFTLNGISFNAGEEAHIGFLFREKLGGMAPTGNTKLYWFEAWQQTQGKPNRDGTVSLFVDAPTTFDAGGGTGGGDEGGGGVIIDNGDKNIQEKKKDGDSSHNFKEKGINLETEKTERKEENTLLTPQFTAYPNPFENNLTVEYTLHKEGTIEICLTDALSRCILDIVPLQKQAIGAYKKAIDTKNISAGLYYIELKNNGKVYAKKMVRIN